MTTSRQILILGGTSWLGGTLARRALERGHDVTCLARGEAGPAPDGVTWVRADRRDDGAYDPVAGQEWDAVVDVSWQPELVRSALTALAPRAQRWLYVSSLSVYRDDSTPGADESAALHDAWSEVGEASIEEYGPAKVACENACLESIASERLLVARAGLICGYGDRSDRFGYWTARLARGGREVLVPEAGLAVQVVDVEDLAGWLIKSVEVGTSGVYNAVGDTVRLHGVLEGCAGAAGTSPRWAPASQQRLEAHGVQPWSGPDSLPLWLPQPDYAGFMTRRNGAATAAGLRFRPLSETITASLRWERELGLDRARKAGLTAEREAELVAAL